MSVACLPFSLATRRKRHDGQGNEKCPMSCCTCRAKRRFRFQSVPKVPCVPRDMDIAQTCSKNDRGALVQQELRKRGPRGTRFVRSCTVDMHMDMSQESFNHVLVKMRGAFGGLFVWQAQYSVNLGNVLKTSNIAFLF